MDYKQSNFSSRLVIVVSGMVSRIPFQGGATWAILQYLLGLDEMGHQVFFVDPISPSSIRPCGSSLEASENARYFREVNRDFGLFGKSALLLTGTKETVGLRYEALRLLVSRADLLLNVSGALRDDSLLEKIPLRAYLDLHPGFTQLWAEEQGVDTHFKGHNRFVTVGGSIGQADCTVPLCGKTWIPTLQPVVLSRWSVSEDIHHDSYTTVGNWRSNGSMRNNGAVYGQKAHAWREFMELPRLTGQLFSPALAIHPNEQGDLLALKESGWRLLDPRKVSSTPTRYQEFIRQSRAEFSVAKSGYVLSRSGRFSERSAAYLASGKPVITQDTGFSRHLPVGKGLFAFSTVEEAADAVARVEKDYDLHRGAARRIAQEFFDSRKILHRLLQNLENGVRVDRSQNNFPGFKTGIKS
ncbi:MAG TPA: hypothetical protein VKZ59_09160 [Acidobacteriota bacterium]|nr:hypothetical protein [Acidobacteriota bacterium]